MIAHLMPPTYDYGGLETVQVIVESPDKVHDLNYEQRADIYSDYCLLLLGKRPGSATLQDAMQILQGNQASKPRLKPAFCRRKNLFKD